MTSALHPLARPAIVGQPTPPGPLPPPSGAVFGRLLAPYTELPAAAETAVEPRRSAQGSVDAAESAAGGDGDRSSDDDRAVQPVDEQPDDAAAPLPAGSAASNPAAAADVASEPDPGHSPGSPRFSPQPLAAPISMDPEAAATSDALAPSDLLAPDMAAEAAPAATVVPDRVVTTTVPTEPRPATAASPIPTLAGPPAAMDRSALSSSASAGHPATSGTAEAASDRSSGGATPPVTMSHGGAGAAAASGVAVMTTRAAEPARSGVTATATATTGAIPAAPDAAAAAMTTAAPADGGSDEFGDGHFDGRGFGNGGAADGAAAASSTRTARDTHRTPAASPAQQVAVSIIRAARNGLSRIQIELSPEHLGRLDIRLEMTKDHHLAVSVQADSAETLNLLRADARALHDALASAGFSTDGSGLSFGLRDQGQAPTGGSTGRAAARSLAATEADAAAADTPAPPSPGPLVAARLDIRA